MASTSTQVKILFQKNFSIYIRNKKMLMKEALIPVITALSIASTNDGQSSFLPIQILFPISLLSYVRWLMVEVVHDKAEKYKEFLKINGVSQTAYLLSLIIFGYFKVAIFSLLTCSGFLFLGPTEYNKLDFFLLYFGVGVGLTHFALFLTTFFSSKQLCSDVGGFIFTGLSFMYTAAMDSTSPIWYYISLLFPQNLLSYGIIFWMENQDPKTLDVSGSTFFETFLFDSVLYFLLFMYFDQIMPDSFGVKKKWYFCLQRCASRRSVEQSPLNLEHISFVSDHLSTTDTSRVLIDSDDSSSAMHHEHFENAENNKRSVTIEHISKTFGSVSEKVIDDLSLMIYEKQVYCLLGHNGAGKTTMINILTGILNFDGG